MTIAQIDAELTAIRDRLNDLYWVFTRTARGVPPACTEEGRRLYQRRAELETLRTAAMRRRKRTAMFKNATLKIIASLRRKAVDSNTRSIATDGLVLSFEQADDLGQEVLDWARQRLGVTVQRTDADVTLMPEITWSMRDVHVVDRMTRETTCYTASLYANEHRAAKVISEGNGGPPMYTIADPRLRAEFAAYAQRQAGEWKNLADEVVLAALMVDAVEERKRARRARSTRGVEPV